MMPIFLKCLKIQSGLFFSVFRLKYVFFCNTCMSLTIMVYQVQSWYVELLLVSSFTFDVF